MTRDDIVAALIDHHRWRTGDGTPSELIVREMADPGTLTDLEAAELAAYRANPPARLILAHEDLSNLDLSGLDLRMVDMRGANLSGADLRNSQLSHSDLRGADLEGTRLSSASVDDSTRLHGIQVNAACGCLTSARALLTALHGDTVAAQMKGLVDAINTASAS